MNNRTIRRGVSLIWTTIMLLVMIGIIGLGIDTAWVLLVNQQLQHAADASALAGARFVRNDEAPYLHARQRSVNIAGLNAAGIKSDGSGSTTLQLDPTADVIVGRYNRITRTFTTDLQGLRPNAVRVHARRTGSSLTGTFPLIFAPAYTAITGSTPITHANAERASTAMVVGGFGAGLLVLDDRPDPSGRDALTVTGNSLLGVYDGSIHVNSRSARAVLVDGSGIIDAEELNVVGSTPFTGSPGYGTVVNNGVPPMPDPLAHLPAPPTDPLVVPLGQIIEDPPGVFTYTPGRYPNGISVQTNGQQHHFQSGIYILDRPTSGLQPSLRITGGIIRGQEVMFYVQTGEVFLTANADIHLTPHETGTYEHVTIFQARSNTASATIRGGNLTSIDGTLYFPRNHVSLSGTSADFGTQMISWRLTITGNNNLTIVYDGWLADNFTRVFLVR